MHQRGATKFAWGVTQRHTSRRTQTSNSAESGIPRIRIDNGIAGSVALAPERPETALRAILLVGRQGDQRRISANALTGRAGRASRRLAQTADHRDVDGIALGKELPTLLALVTL
jgi:hypothetical protein